MIGSPVAKRYASALHELATETKVTEKVGKDLGALATAFGASADMKSVFENPRFSAKEKAGVLQAVCARLAVHESVKKTSQLLLERGRLKHLGEIAEAYDHIAQKSDGRVRAEVVSATELSADYYTRIQQTIEKATGKKVVVVRRTDPSLIGGVVTTVEGKVFDGSLKNGLRRLKSDLLGAASET